MNFRSQRSSIVEINIFARDFPPMQQAITDITDNYRPQTIFPGRPRSVHPPSHCGGASSNNGRQSRTSKIERQHRNSKVLAFDNKRFHPDKKIQLDFNTGVVFVSLLSLHKEKNRHSNWTQPDCKNRLRFFGGGAPVASRCGAHQKCSLVPIT
ncbi:hypothetical protein CDAR_612251 [Caerostris darwini]|uniref:Uncharacterized protein n=1 Tax=Caerostris darwini TaxID=1538125 RepID=A0AAV4RWM7_9ARAC|nr:hypothetical protein CDAR_612251 [Caerostris darwini]